MSGTNPNAPRFAASNIADSSGSSMAGLALIANSVGNAVAANGLPTTTPQWIAFGTQLLAGILALFGR